MSRDPKSYLKSIWKRTTLDVSGRALYQVSIPLLCCGLWIIQPGLLSGLWYAHNWITAVEVYLHRAHPEAHNPCNPAQVLCPGDTLRWITEDSCSMFPSSDSNLLIFFPKPFFLPNDLDQQTASARMPDREHILLH